MGWDGKDGLLTKTRTHTLLVVGTTFLYEKTHKTVRVDAASRTFNVKTREFCSEGRLPRIFTCKKCVVSYANLRVIWRGLFGGDTPPPKLLDFI